MFVRVTSTPNSPRKSVKVVNSVREGLKVRQHIIHHVGIASDASEIEKLKQLGHDFIEQERQKQALNGELIVKKRGRKPLAHLEAIAEDEQINLCALVEERRVIEGLHEVGAEVFYQMGYERLLKGKKEQELLLDIILMRLANPGSKYKAQRLLEKRYNKAHDLDAIYRMMDKIHPKIADIKTATFQRAQQIMPNRIDMLFYDCTTLYFESTETDDLRRFGYSKDHRFNTTQLVLALATNQDGLPLGYELFEGNQAEVGTLIKSIESWSALFPIGEVCLVADRAMMSEANLSLLESKGYHYVVAAKLRAMPHELKQQLLSDEHYQLAPIGSECAWIGEFSYKKRRLIASYKAKRAQRDARQREQVLKKINKTLGSEGDTHKLITNQGVKKYTSSSDSVTVLDDDKINEDSAWDGMHGMLTNMREASAVDVLSRYARLWKIEESFRLNKHTLSMRPIFHFKKERIETHIAICYMAFAMLRHLEYQVALTQKLSPQCIIEELMDVQSSILLDVSTEKRYRLPGAFSHQAGKIYKALKLQRERLIKEIV